MRFTIEFIEFFVLGLYYVAPVLLILVAAIVLLGQWVGRSEGWSRLDSLYYAFITASTVGYGDFHPKSPLGKGVAIAIALSGLLLTGIVVAVAVKAAAVAFEDVYAMSVDQIGAFGSPLRAPIA